VRLVFLLLMPPREYDRSLQLLSAMARLLTREDVRRGLCEAGDAAAVRSLLEEAERPEKARGPAFVRSGASRSQGA
jgi:mannitol/fructose-specific phosphotransferase system IIA component (Ntr-type)